MARRTEPVEGRPLVVGVDVGGTFTDFVALDESTGRISIFKRPTTLTDQSEAILGGLESNGIACSTIRSLTHGTTTATNAVIERKGAACGLVATRGFRDVLELGRRERPHLYGLAGTFEPLVPRHRRLEIGGRLDHLGRVVQPNDPTDLRDLIVRLAELDVQAVAIALLHSYANPDHELEVEEAITSALPEILTVRSSALHPERGEFERSSTAVIAAYVAPTVSSYFSRLQAGLQARGFPDDFRVVQSNGGASSFHTALRGAHTTINSGPAAGVTAVAALARSRGVNVVSFDMGGTSADLALIADGEATRRTESSLGFRLPLQAPVVDISAIGAGGGSIARVDAGGVLRVGPSSAGSRPGPACFGWGGQLPTVTDAHVVLGHLHTASMRQHGIEVLSVQLAAAAIEREIAGPLAIAVSAAAEAILAVVNETMAGQIRLMTVDRGADVRNLSLVAYGGSGPLHACALVRRLELRSALVPVAPGVTSAMGCVQTPLLHEVGQPVHDRLDRLDVAALERMVGRQRRIAEEALVSQGVPTAEVGEVVTAVMAYEGQRHALEITATEDQLAQLAELFEAKYEATFSGTLAAPIVVRSLRVSLAEPVKARALLAGAHVEVERVTPESPEVKGWFQGAPTLYRVLARADLVELHEVEGPAILLQPDSTVLVEPGFMARAGDDGVITLERDS
jgi:N-methylhydantoinase A